MAHVVTQKHRDAWFHNFVVDGSGFPTSDTARKLIQYLFNHRNSPVDSLELACEVFAHRTLVSQMCRQLAVIDVVREEPRGSDCWRYNVQPCDFNIQQKVECALAQLSIGTGHRKLPDFPPCWLPADWEDRLEYASRRENSS